MVFLYLIIAIIRKITCVLWYQSRNPWLVSSLLLFAALHQYCSLGKNMFHKWKAWQNTQLLKSIWKAIVSKLYQLEMARSVTTPLSSRVPVYSLLHSFMHFRDTQWEYILSLLAQLITYSFFIHTHRGKGIFAIILVLLHWWGAIAFGDFVPWLMSSAPHPHHRRVCRAYYFTKSLFPLLLQWGKRTFTAIITALNW